MDTYFFDYKEAYKEARKRNKFTIFNNLQICYYNGKHKESPYENLIGLPLDELCDYLSETPNRGISEIKFTNQFAKKQQQEMAVYIDALQKIAWQKKNSIGVEYRKAVKSQEPNFNEPWRILFVTTRGTTVLQYVAKNLADAFNDLGYSTFISIEQNAMQNWGADDSHENANFAWHLKNIYEYNPHVIFNLDWINNTFLNDKVFNFVWFQDYMPILRSDEKIYLRKRDFVYALNNDFKTRLESKNVNAEYQPFCTNEKIFKIRDNIERKDKIVFIGSSYKVHYDAIEREDKEFLLELLLKSYLENGVMTNDEKELLAIKYDVHDMLGHIVNYVERDMMLLHIIKDFCLDLPIEIYGNGWEKYPELNSCYKGVLPYGETISKVYNSAKYFLVLGGYVLQQRVFEGTASGTIPLVLDVRKNDFDYISRYDTSFLFFEKPTDLKNLIANKDNVDLSIVNDDHKYSFFVNKIINTVKKNLNG